MKSLAIAAVAVLVGSGAYAADIGSYKDSTPPTYPTNDYVRWDGWYFGGFFGYSDSGAKVSRNARYSGGAVEEEIPVDETAPSAITYTELDSFTNAGSETFGGDFVFGGVELSYKILPGNGNVVLEPFIDVSIGGDKISQTWENAGTHQLSDDALKGIYGEYWGQHKIDKCIADPARYYCSAGWNEAGAFSVEQNWGSSAGAKIGVILDKKFYINVFGGIAYASYDVKASSALLASYNGWGSKDFDGPFPATAHSDTKGAWGWTAGIGAQYPLTDRIFWDFQARYTDIGSIKAAVSGLDTDSISGGYLRTDENLVFDPAGVWSFRTGLTYHIR